MVKPSALAVLAVAGCAGGPIDRTESPTGLMTSPARVSVTCVPVGGSSITVTTTGESKVTGELIAADPDELDVLVADGHMLRLRADQIARADVSLYSNNAIVAVLTAWAIAGTASALSHGVFFSISGPTWTAVSTVAIAPVAADPGRFVTVKDNLGRLYQYARFPGGMPMGVDETSLRKSFEPTCE